MASIYFTNQNLGIFQSDFSKIGAALSRVSFSDRFKVGTFAVFNLDQDLLFPAQGSIKRIYYGVSQPLATGQLNVCVVARQCLFNRCSEKAAFETLAEAKRVIHPLEIEWKDGFEYIVSELCNQGDLSSFLIRSGRGLEKAQKDWISYSVAIAVLECHTFGVVLRDFKPANVLVHQSVDSPIDLKISDLGLAFLMKEGSKQESIRFAGTLGYIAPESWEAYVATKRGSPATYSHDAWSLGCFLHDLASGVPFQARVLRGADGSRIGATTRALYSCCLGTFSLAIRELLTKNPQYRPSVPSICKLMYSVFKFEESTTPDLRQELEVLLARALPSAHWQIEEGNSLRQFMADVPPTISEIISNYIN